MMNMMLQSCIPYSEWNLTVYLQACACRTTYNLEPHTEKVLDSDVPPDDIKSTDPDEPDEAAEEEQIQYWATQ